MTEILELEGLADPRAARAVDVLEHGGLVHFPKLPFAVSAQEIKLIDPSVLDARSKNVSFDPVTQQLSGVGDDAARPALIEMIQRYAGHAGSILGALTPCYEPYLQRRRTSFRPGAIETRALSPRKDDRRLHVDAFPANPVQGRRIFRVFTNVNPSGQTRLWRIGGSDFSAFAASFSDQLKPRAAGAWREWVGLTHGRRTAYDSAMLHLHDAAKRDERWQRTAEYHEIAFQPGASWVVYTDSVLHAALSGQHALEQTYLMPVEGMAEEHRSPLRILERLLQRSLL